MKVAVALSGCGRMDGSEVHESVLSLFFLSRAGIPWQCIGTDADQVRVVDHWKQQPREEKRNQIVEAARIARGDIQPIHKTNPADFDGLVIPGGSGAFQNWSQGPGDVHPELKKWVLAMADAKKPIAAICIAPVLAARILGSRGVKVTIGNDAETIEAIEATGARHVEAAVDEIVVDEKLRVVSTPAYMLGPGIADVAAGIEKAMNQMACWLKGEG